MDQLRSPKLGILLAVLLSATTAVVFAQSEGGSTVNCASNGSDLQNKIDNASLGATLYVTGPCAKGPYTVTRDIKLLAFGANGATLSAPNGGHVLIVQGAVLRVEGVSIQGGAGIGILVHGGSLFANNIVIENAANNGVRVGVHSHATITNSTVRHNGGYGIEITESSGAILEGNTVTHNTTFGIGVNRSSSAIIDRNTIGNNALVGLLVESNASVLILNNTISNNGVGFLVRRSGFVDTVNPPNTFSGNGTDVQCFERGMIDAADGPQLPAGGTVATDSSCMTIGSMF